jgi:hypothetical protein
LALIQNKQALTYFEDFKPISCCNLIYKLVAKIIENLLKFVFSEIISEEQYGFLFKRQIHDVISLTRKTIHSIKLENMPSIVVKLDLSKSYDKVS